MTFTSSVCGGRMRNSLKSGKHQNYPIQEIKLSTGLKSVMN